MKPELAIAIATKQIFESVDKGFADAFYLGNPYCSKIKGNLIVETEALNEVIHEIKALGKKAYYSTIGVPVGKEIDVCKNGIETAVKAGADAVEIHDMGLLRWAKREVSTLPIHIGHFANIYNVHTARFFKDYGIRRLLPSHELTYEENISLLALKDIEFEASVYGALPLGYANNCLLLLDFPSREQVECAQQCSEGIFYVEYPDWYMRSAGNALVSGDDLCLISDLPKYLNYTSLRLETLYDDPEKINNVAKIFREALDVAFGCPDSYDADKYVKEMIDLCGSKLCDGWKKGISGKDFSWLQSKPLAAEKV